MTTNNWIWFAGWLSLCLAASLYAGCTAEVFAQDQDEHGHEESGHDHDHDHDADHGHDDADAHAEDDAHDHSDHEGHDHGDDDGHGHSMRDGVAWCGEHDLPEAECGICSSASIGERAVGDGMKVRFGSAESLTKAGVQVGKPESRTGRRVQHLLGEVTFDGNHLAVVTPLGQGIITEVAADVGDQVKAGQLLATVSSHAVAEAKSAYVKALADADLARQVLAREQDMHAREISARQDLERARAEAQAAATEVDHARQHLMNLGLSAEEAEAVTRSREAGPLLPIRAPFAGTVVDRQAVIGNNVETGTVLFRVADLSQMWMKLAIPEAQLGQVAVGAPVQARFEAYPDLVFPGTLTWLAYRVDPQTRTVEARAVLDNPQGQLRDGLFGEATLAGTETAGVSLPASAVQDVDGRPMVFVKLDEDLYDARLVRLGDKEDGRVYVAAGLSPDETVALQGSHILKGEFLKARLGAGCADH